MLSWEHNKSSVLWFLCNMTFKSTKFIPFTRHLKFNLKSISIYWVSTKKIFIHSRNIRYVFHTGKPCQILGGGGWRLINNVPSLKIRTEKGIKNCKCESTGRNGPPEDFYLPEKERCGFGRGKEVTMRYVKWVVKKSSTMSSGKEIMGASWIRQSWLEHSREGIEGIQACRQRWWERCAV